MPKVWTKCEGTLGKVLAREALGHVRKHVTQLARAFLGKKLDEGSVFDPE
jgi:hypothetical protein